MITLPSAFQTALLAGDYVTRYAIISGGVNPPFYISAQPMAFNIDENALPFGRALWGKFKWGRVKAVALQVVTDWGETVVGTDIAATTGIASIPSTERRIRCLNTEETGWFANLFAVDRQENRKIEIHAICGGVDIIEDSLLIRDPISYSESSEEIEITGISIFNLSRDKMGTLDPVTNEYTSLVIGDIGLVQGTFSLSLSDAYALLSTVVNPGATTITADRDLLAAGFASSGQITIDYETITYTSISGGSNNVFNISPAAVKGHASGRDIFVSGGSYFYTFGPGPVDTVGALMVYDGADWITYTGEYTVHKDSSTVSVEFPGSMPCARVEGKAEETITKTVTTADATFYNGGSASGSLTVRRSGGATSEVTIASFGSQGLTLPAGATFKSGYVRSSYTVKSWGTSGTAQKTITNGISSVSEMPSWAYYNGSEIGANTQVYPGSYSVARIDFGGLSLPAGATFISGFLHTDYTTDSGSEYLTTMYEHALDHTQDGSYSAGHYTHTKYASSASQLDAGSNYMYLGITVYPPWWITGWIAQLGNNYVSMTYSYPVYYNNVIWCKMYEKTLGIQRVFSSQYGEVVVNNTYTATNEAQLATINNSWQLNLYSGWNSWETVDALVITEIKLSMTYETDAQYYPQRSVYSATNSKLQIGSEGATTNPAALVQYLLALKGIGGYIDSASYTAALNFFSTNLFSFNGYLPGGEDLDKLLLDTLTMAGIRLVESQGAIYYKLAGLLSAATEDYESTAAHRIGNDISVEHQGLSDIVNKITVRYDKNGDSFAGSYVAHNDPSITQYSTQAAADLDMYLVGDIGYAKRTSDVIATVNANPYALISFTCDRTAYGIQVYDKVKLTTTFCGLGSIYGQVVRISKRYTGGNSSGPDSFNITIACGGEGAEIQNALWGRTAWGRFIWGRI